MEGSDSVPTPGDFVEVRTRRWLVEGVTGGGAQVRARLACIDDDAQGDALEVLWRDELDASVVADNHLSVFENPGTDDPEVFSAYLRSIRWNTATAADRKLLQAPFRAGIHLDAYQLVPLAKALALPRVNLLIADDVGAGKTIEAGLILRELILRRRVDFVVVCAPPSMTRQWQDELQAKFGLAFTIIDREYLPAVRRERGFAVNPWSSGSLFLLSHSLVTDEVYTAGLRDVLSEFRARSLLILDEAHHAAPASGSRYAVDSQFTRAIEALAPRFEHRLFLTATPHNGHSNSFTKLLEILDPQRFTAGVDVQPDDLAPVMVRRLKSDLKRFGENFPTRRVEATLDQLEQALRENRTPSPAIVERLRASAIRDAGDLESELQRRAEARRSEVARDLVAVGDQEEALRKLLVEQRERIAKREAPFDDRQLPLEFDRTEAEQARRDRRRWQANYERLAREIESEPERVRQGYKCRCRPAGDRRPRPPLAQEQLT